MAGMGANRSPACHKRFGISEAKIKPTKPNKRGPLVRIRPESGRVRRGGQGFSGRRLATCARAAPITAARRALRSQAQTNAGPRASAGGRGGPRRPPPAIACPRSTHWVPHDSQRGPEPATRSKGLLRGRPCDDGARAAARPERFGALVYGWRCRHG